MMRSFVTFHRAIPEAKSSTRMQIPVGSSEQMYETSMAGSVKRVETERSCIVQM